MTRRGPVPFSPVLGTLLSAGMLLLAGCTTAPDGRDDDHDVTVATMEQDSYGQGPDQPDERVFGDHESWGSFWQEHAERKGGTAIAATPPQVDFESEFVVFVYAGQKSTGGHAIEFTNMTFEGDGYAAKVTKHEPGDDCITTDALTYPYHLVRVTRADGDPGGTPDVTFDHETNTYSCGTARNSDRSDPDPSRPPGTPNPMRLDTLDEGSYPEGPTVPEDRVIADNETWQVFWQEHHERQDDRDQAATAPAVDFDRAFVLFAYAGEKRSGGYAIHIDDVYQSGGTHVANVADIKPGPDCVTTQALTHPYHLVRVTRSTGDDGGTPDVRFEHWNRTMAC